MFWGVFEEDEGGEKGDGDLHEKGPKIPLLVKDLPSFLIWDIMILQRDALNLPLHSSKSATALFTAQQLGLKAEDQHTRHPIVSAINPPDGAPQLDPKEPTRFI